MAIDRDADAETRYYCSNCGWEGQECDRRDHYPICPQCSLIVDVLDAGRAEP